MAKKKPKIVKGPFRVAAAETHVPRRQVQMDSVVLQGFKEGKTVSHCLSFPAGNLESLLESVEHRVDEICQEVSDQPGMPREAKLIYALIGRVREHVKRKQVAAAAIAALKLGAEVQWKMIWPYDDRTEIGIKVRAGGKKGSQEAYPNKDTFYRELFKTWKIERPRQKSDYATDVEVARQYGVNYKTVERARKQMAE